ncbi:cysteine proteinase inhibitor 5-like protein [Tanacetum coccineum]
MPQRYLSELVCLLVILSFSIDTDSKLAGSWEAFAIQMRIGPDSTTDKQNGALLPGYCVFLAKSLYLGLPTTFYIFLDLWRRQSIGVVWPMQEAQIDFAVAPILTPLSYTHSDLSLGRQVLVGNWTPVNPSDPLVMEIGKFAVDEHNKEVKASLRYENVVNGESQVVEGIKYNLTIKAADGTVENNHQAVVWDKPSPGSRQLISFT